MALAVDASLRGSLDFTSINARGEFLRAAIGVSASVGVLSVIAHVRVFGDARRLLGDQVTLVVLLVVALALHPFVYGWPLGFPLPSAGMLFFVHGLLLVHAALGAAVALRR